MTETDMPTPSSKPISHAGTAQPAWDQWAGHRHDCAQLISENSNFIVYLTKNLKEVDWEATDAYLREKGINASDCQSRITYLESLPRRHLNQEVQLSFECQLGEAMVQALKGNPKKSNLLLTQATRFLKQKNQEYARRTYVLTSFLLATGIMTCTVLLLALKDHWIFKSIPAWAWNYAAIISVGIGGSLGTLLFTFARVSTTAFAPDAEVMSHLVEAASRLSVGLIVAIVAICAIKAGFLLQQFADNKYALFVVCVAAGYSERFGSSIVEYLDHMLSKGTKAKESVPSKPKRRTKAKSVRPAAMAEQTNP